MRPKWLTAMFALCFLAGAVTFGWDRRERARSAVPAAWSRALTQPQYPSGGYGVTLQHAGEPLPPERWFQFLPGDAAFNSVGTVTAEHEARPNTPDLDIIAVNEPLWSHDSAAPQRLLELTDGDGVLWRLGYGAVLDSRDVTPDLSRLVGKPIRLWVQRSQFGVADFVSVRIDDERGLVMALDWGNDDLLAGVDLTVDVGRRLFAFDDGCGGNEIRTLDFEADTSLILAPGQHGTLSLDGAPYEARALAATTLTRDQRCTDMFSNIAWFVFRLS